MASELTRRLGRLRVPALLKMRYYKGPYELVNWWDHFISTIPKNAEFNDLDTTTQNMILDWEREIIESLPKTTSFSNMDLETQAMVSEWQRGEPEEKR